MSQRDVNVEGLEKSFATNVMGESHVRGEVWRKPREEKQMWLRSCCVCPPSPILVCPLAIYILTKSLIPLLEKSADPRVVSQMDERRKSESPHQVKMLNKIFKEWHIEAFVIMIYHLNEHLMGVGYWDVAMKWLITGHTHKIGSIW